MVSRQDEIDEKRLGRRVRTVYHQVQGTSKSALLYSNYRSSTRRFDSLVSFCSPHRIGRLWDYSQPQHTNEDIQSTACSAPLLISFQQVARALASSYHRSAAKKGTIESIHSVRSRAIPIGAIPTQSIPFQSLQGNDNRSDRFRFELDRNQLLRSHRYEADCSLLDCLGRYVPFHCKPARLFSRGFVWAQRNAAQNSTAATARSAQHINQQQQQQQHKTLTQQWEPIYPLL